MNSEILPIGSVVLVDNMTLMINGYFKPGTVFNNEKYDYMCCFYPTGLSEQTALLKKEQIQKVLFIGYQAPEFRKLKKELETNE